MRKHNGKIDESNRLYQAERERHDVALRNFAVAAQRLLVASERDVNEAARNVSDALAPAIRARLFMSTIAVRHAELAMPQPIHMPADMADWHAVATHGLLEDLRAQWISTDPTVDPVDPEVRQP